MGKNQKLTKENLLEDTPESSESEESVVPPKKVAKEAPSKPQQKAPEAPAKPAKEDGKKKSEKAQKEVPRKESGHSNKDEVPKAPKKDKPAKKEEVAAPKKEEVPKKQKEEAKLGKRDAPSKVAAAPKKTERVREISSDSSSSHSSSSESSDEEEKPKAPPKKEEKAPKKEEKAVKKEEKAVKKEEKTAPTSKKSDISAPESKKASFHESETAHVDKNKKVKPSAPAAAPKKEAESKVHKMKQALKKQESSESEEMEVEEEDESMEVEEEAPKPRKASADKTAAPRKASAEKQAVPRKASAEKTAVPRKASAEKIQATQPAQHHQNSHQNSHQNQFQNQGRPAFNRDNNAGNSRYGPQYEVIVFGLPFQSSEEDIRGHFGEIQDILNVKVMMGQDGRPRGKAFIKFGSEQSMNDALALNGSNLGGRNISVELTDKMKGDNQGGQGGFQGGNRQNFQPRQNYQAGPPEHVPENTNVMVKNLAFSVDEAKLQNVFAGCGPIKQVRICKKEDGSSRGFGFIDFTSLESSKNALKKSGEKIDGRNIEVNYSRPRDPNAPRQGGFGGGRPGGFGGRPGGFGAEKKGALTQFTGEAVELD